MVEPELARWLSIAGLLMVASGWRPRYTGVLHWYICASLQWSASILDGGDQVCMVLALLLVPVTLLDPRPWHWSAPPPPPVTAAALTARMISFSAFWMIRLQVMVIYYYAGVAKYGVEEWTDGTALFYWFQHPTFGAPDLLRPVVMPLIYNAALLPLLTWSVLLLEAALAFALFWPLWARRPLLVAAVFFHAAIAAIHGIPTFALAMQAALILYLADVSRPLPLEFATKLLGVLRPTHAYRRRPVAVLGDAPEFLSKGESIP